MNSEINRVDIYLISKEQTGGSEQFSGRPAVIVSCNALNRAIDTVEIVYLTTRPKAEVPTHVVIWSAKYKESCNCAGGTGKYSKLGH